MDYRCRFPNCTYETAIRTQIHKHHIVPKEHGGHNKESNRIELCPNHHSRIYIENTKGMHASRGNDSIILIGWKESTRGKVLHYIEDGKEKFGDFAY